MKDPYKKPGYSNDEPIPFRMWVITLADAIKEEQVNRIIGMAHYNPVEKNEIPSSGIVTITLAGLEQEERTKRLDYLLGETDKVLQGSDLEQSPDRAVHYLSKISEDEIPEDRKEEVQGLALKTAEAFLDIKRRGYDVTEKPEIDVDVEGAGHVYLSGSDPFQHYIFAKAGKVDEIRDLSDEERKMPVDILYFQHALNVPYLSEEARNYAEEQRLEIISQALKSHASQALGRATMDSRWKDYDTKVEWRLAIMEYADIVSRQHEEMFGEPIDLTVHPSYEAACERTLNSLLSRAKDRAERPVKIQNWWAANLPDTVAEYREKAFQKVPEDIQLAEKYAAIIGRDITQSIGEIQRKLREMKVETGAGSPLELVSHNFGKLRDSIINILS